MEEEEVVEEYTDGPLERKDVSLRMKLIFSDGVFLQFRTIPICW